MELSGAVACRRREPKGKPQRFRKFFALHCSPLCKQGTVTRNTRIGMLLATYAAILSSQSHCNNGCMSATALHAKTLSISQIQDVYRCSARPWSKSNTFNNQYICTCIDLFFVINICIYTQWCLATHIFYCIQPA